MPVYQKKDKNGKVIKDTKGNSWYFRCYYTDIYGKKKQRKSKLYLTKSLAQEEERTFKQSLKTNSFYDTDVKFIDVYEEWLNFKKEKIKITTFYGVAKETNKHLLTYFKDYKLKNINTTTINSWKQKLNKQKLSIDWKNKIITHLKELLEYASIYYGFDPKIAHTLIKIRNDQPKSLENKSKTNYWTYDEFNKFIKCVDDEYYNLIFTFLYRTGLRIGEFRALNWNDVDLINKKLKVTKSMSKDCLFEKKSIVVSPKTENSIRCIDLDNRLVNLLIDYKKEQEKYYGFNNDWFVFGGVHYTSATTLRRYLNDYIAKADVKKITIHGFRHSHVSLLINLGCDFKDVSERIGNTISMIQNTYYHMFPEQKKIIIERINEL